MKHVTTIIRWSAVLSILAVLSAGSVWAQPQIGDACSPLGGIQPGFQPPCQIAAGVVCTCAVASVVAGNHIFAERNGVGTMCEEDSPCDLNAAIAEVQSEADSVWVRVREAGDMTRIDEDIEVVSSFNLVTYESGSGKVVAGGVIVEGDFTITGATVTVVKNTTLMLESDEVTMTGEAAFKGAVALGGGRSTQKLYVPDGANCVVGAFERLTVQGDVEVLAPNGCSGAATTPRVTIQHMLSVKDAAVLDMGDVELAVIPVVEMEGEGDDAREIRGMASVESGARIEGDEYFILYPEAPVSGTGLPADTTVLVEHVNYGIRGIRPPFAYYGPCLALQDPTDNPNPAFPTCASPPTPICTPSPENNNCADFIVPSRPRATGEVIRFYEPQNAIEEAPAIPARITVRWYRPVDGYDVSMKECFRVSGGGSISMDIRKEGQGGACIDLPELGGGGMNTVLGGSLMLTGTTRIDGSLRNVGRARTELWQIQEITEDVEIFGVNRDDTDEFAGDVGSRFLTDSSLGCDDEGTSSRGSGVYIYSPVRIYGSVFLDETQQDQACPTGLHFLGDNMPGTANGSTEAGQMSTVTSTIFGSFESSGNASIDLGSWNFHHNVAFEDDLDIDFSTRELSFDDIVLGNVRDDFVFNMASPARSDADASTSGDQSAPAAQCSYSEDREAAGNKVIFAGDLDQDIRYTAGETFRIEALQLNKLEDDNSVYLRSGAALSVADLEVRSGKLITNGRLDLSSPQASGTLVLHAGGEISKGSADMAYAARDAVPARIRYTGSGDDTSGDEVYGEYMLEGQTLVFSVGSLEVYKPEGSTATLNETVEVSDVLGLYSGELAVAPEKNLFIERGVSVEYGSGDIAQGEDGVSFRMGTDFSADQHGLDLSYVGAGERDAGHMWETDMTAPGPALVRDVTIDGDLCGMEAHPVIRLNPGFSRFDGRVDIVQGALDLAGQQLVAFAADDNLSQAIDIREGGKLCDSSAGLACTGSRAAPGADQRDRIDAFGLPPLAERFPVEYKPSIKPEPGELVQLTGTVRKEAYMREDDAAAAPVGVEIAEAIVRSARMASRTGSAAAIDELGGQLELLKSSQSLAAKAADNGGTVHLLGNGDTEVNVHTGGKMAQLPGFVVGRQLDEEMREGSVAISGTGLKAPGPGDNSEPNLDGVRLHSLTLKNGAVTFDPTVEVVHVMTDLEQQGGKFSLSDNASDLNSVPDDQPWGLIPQTLRVGTDEMAGLHMQSGGSFAANGGHVYVFGDFTVASDSGSVSQFDLNRGTHMVTGNFFVGPGAGDGMSSYRHGNGCADARLSADTLAHTIVMGDYQFAGRGDCYKDHQYPASQQGLSGLVSFMGDSTQTVMVAADPDANFGSVTVHSAKDDPTQAIVLGSSVAQNEYGKLTLRRGVVDTVDETYLWSVYGTDIEENLSGRNMADPDSGTVTLGSRDSYVNGPFARAVAFGNAGGGVVTGGYLFPVGQAADSMAMRQVAMFRPLMLQFPADLGATGMVTVDYLQDVSVQDFEWPDVGMVVDAYGGGTLTLDAVGNQFWMVRFDKVPAHDPNIRVVAPGLPNVFDARGLRLIQWDCDMTNPRLAGVYDLESDDTNTDDESFAVNDRVNGILNLTQEGVEVEECSVVGIASNLLQNPINLPPQLGGFANVQYIQNVAGTPVDVYMDGYRVGNDWAFQSATQFVNISGGEHKIDIVAPGDTDNSNPIASETIEFRHDSNYNLIVHGDGSEVSIKVVKGVRMRARDANSMEFFIVHGARELGSVDLRLLNPTNNSEVLNLLANNIAWEDVGAYIRLEPGGYNLEISTANNDRQIEVFRLELQDFYEQTFVLNLSGSGKSSAEGLALLGVEQDGSTFLPSIITAIESEEELPTEFALKGNYPNPFNPSTNIQIDLPESAVVRVEIIDILGRHVMTVTTQELEAGANRNIEVNAASLASGTYLYRVFAKSVSGTNAESGRMVLVK